MMIMAGVGDQVQRTGDGQAQVGYSMAGRSRVWVALCVDCTVYKETRSTCFFVQPQNQGRQFGLKTSGYGSCGSASKPLAQVSLFGPQNW
jgi:hypothetical protein